MKKLLPLCALAALTLTGLAAPKAKAKPKFDEALWKGMLKEVTSSRDGTRQLCYFYAPEGASKPIPLIVGLHTWSGDYKQIGTYNGVYREAQKRGWAFVGPNFRGPNSTPPACGGEEAVQDIVDAVHYAQAHTAIDTNRIYIIGGSGGGHMTLLMLGRHPEIFAAGAAFCPITDLARWHADSLLDHPGRGVNYARMMEKACGGTPQTAAAEYARRSPLTYLARAAAAHVPAYIATGIHDGWKGSVPVGHSIRAFNALALAEDRIDEQTIAAIEANQAVPPEVVGTLPNDPFYTTHNRIHLRRTSGYARLTLFEGGHAGNNAAGFDFLARQCKGKCVDWSLPQKAQGKTEALTR